MSAEKPQLRWTCVHPPNMHALDIVEKYKVEISAAEFKKAVGGENIKSLNERFGYGYVVGYAKGEKKGRLNVMNDPFVKFYVSRLPDKTTCWVLDHSCVDFIFY